MGKAITRELLKLEHLLDGELGAPDVVVALRAPRARRATTRA